MEKLPALGGSGGLIAVDREGNVALPFNSEGMYRAWGYVGGDAPSRRRFIVTAKGAARAHGSTVQQFDQPQQVLAVRDHLNRSGFRA